MTKCETFQERNPATSVMLKTINEKNKLQTTTELHSPNWVHKECAYAGPVQCNN